MSAIRLFVPGSEPDDRDRLVSVADLFGWFDGEFPPGRSAVGETERRRIRQLFAADYGDRQCASITPREFLSWLDSQPGVRAANTRSRWIRTIKTPFLRGSEAGIIPRNPLSGVKTPKGQQGRDWSLAEFCALMRGSPLHFRRLLVFVRYSGPRGSEVAGARWDQVDLQAGTITQDRHKTEETGEPRTIFLNRVTRRILALVRQSQAKPSEYVFLNSFGKPWTTHAMQKYFRALVRRLGLMAQVKLHGGRHMFGTSSILAGNDVATTAVLLGHKSLLTTQRYLHLAGKRQHLVAAAEKAGGPGPPRPS